jgi:flagellin FlaB
MRQWAKRALGNQKGITGIETAIILIAFVIVASVFAFVVLSSGLFSTQKAKQVISAGMEEASSAIQIKGNVYAHMTDGIMDSIYFTISTTSEGNLVDFTDTSNNSNYVVITYADPYQVISSVNWTLQKLNAFNDDNVLDKNELFLITVDMTCASANVSADERPGPYHKFQLEIKPPTGAVFVLERTLPARVSDIVNLN